GRGPLPLDGGRAGAVPAGVRGGGPSAAPSVSRRAGLGLRGGGAWRAGAALVGDLEARMALERARDRGSRRIAGPRRSVSIRPASELRGSRDRDGLRPARPRSLDLRAAVLGAKSNVAARPYPGGGTGARRGLGTRLRRRPEVRSAWM